MKIVAAKRSTAPMAPPVTSDPDDDRPRSAAIYEDQLMAVFMRRDRMFAKLFIAQWAFAIVVALVWSPFGWHGKVSTINVHVYVALIFGGFLTLPALAIIRAQPGSVLTRHVVAITQMLWSALLIHLSGGRIETHFHVFASLAYLAFYRDWKVVMTGTLVVVADHLLRGLLWSESVYGITNPEWWRFLEHAFWVVFEDVVLLMSIHENRHEMLALADRQAALQDVAESVERKVVERTNELSASREQFRLLLETTNTIPCELAIGAMAFTYVGPQAETQLGFPRASFLEPSFLKDHLHPDDRAAVAAALAGIAPFTSPSADLEMRLLRADGGYTWVRLIVTLAAERTGVRAPSDDGFFMTGRRPRDPAKQGVERLARGVLLDISATRELEVQLRQSQKLESVGRLASGVAHEINTPVQFVNDNIHFLKGAFDDLATVMTKYQELRAAVLAGGDGAAKLADEAFQAEEAADVAYVLENAAPAIDRSIEGLNRIAEIVRSMKQFAHPDQRDMTAVDLNQALSSTLTMARNEYKYVAEVETKLSEMPPVVCHAGEVNQVFLNIIVNAAHAISDVVQGSEQRGRIVVTSHREGDDAVVSISDSGGGIPESIRDRIFDPFFTTKAVGKGTGQGLAIARSVVVDKHGGDIRVESEVGRGTTFWIRLPIAGRRAPKEKAA